MKRSTHGREEFDPSRAFAVGHRTFKFNGVECKPNARFDKSICDGRRLRQLYDSRMLVMLPENDLESKTSGELRVFLEERGIVPRHTWTRTRLLERAQELAA